MDRTDNAEQQRLRRAVIQRLESLRRSGVTHLPRRTRSQSGSPSPVAAPPKPVAAPQSAALPPPPARTPSDARPAALEVIGREVAACTRCPELVANRTQTVFGVGAVAPRLVFLGEAPGADEDRQGEPFVGRAGQLLNKILEACTLRREDVYILNVLKCRPPDNRTPTPIEAANCFGFLERQLAILSPEYICCLGAVAAQTLLNTKSALGQLRGRFHDFRGFRVAVTYHPAYLLRNPAQKQATWDDMKMLMRAMGIALPGA